jgi:Leucine-rich repeat (LRR) protein
MKKRSVMNKHAARRLNSTMLNGLTPRSFLCASLLVALSLGCEDKKTEEPSSAAATPSAAPAAPSAPAPAPAPEPVAQAEKPKKKLEDCPQDITIENSELEASIRVKAQKPEGAITKADLKKLRSLNLARVAVEDLDICLFHHMTELRELFLPPSGIADLSPIAGSKKMETLGIARNPVVDLSPLADMTNMDRLDLASTQVVDLSPISKMTKMTELTLDGTAVTDLTPIKDMTKLERLSLKSTAIKDITVLQPMKSLKFLYIADSAVDLGQTGSLAQNGTKIVQD